MQLLVHGFGLNVTAATLSAACKYTAPSHKAESRSLIHELTKPGYFASEQDLLARVRSLTGTADCRHPITYLVEAADDIVYSTVDLEDGVKKRVLDWSEVLEQIRLACGSAPIFSRCEAQVQAHVGRADLHGDALAETLATAFRIAAISELVPPCVKTFEKRYGDIMDGQYHDQLILDPDSEATPLIKACKKVLRESLYRSQEILRLEVKGRHVLHDLLNLFWEAASEYDGYSTTRIYAGKLYLLISDNYRRVFEARLRAQKENEKYCRLQLATDQVAGMTDSYACRLHSDLFNG